MLANVADARFGALRGPSTKIGRERSAGTFFGRVARFEKATSAADWLRKEFLPLVPLVANTK